MNRFIQFKGVFKKEVIRFLKVPYQTLGNPIVSAALYLLIFGVSIGRSIEFGAFSYLSFLIPGLIAMGVIRSAFENATSAVIIGKYLNEIQDLRVTPLPHTVISLACGAASFLRGAIVAIITYIIGSVFIYIESKTLLPVYSPLLFIYFLVTGGLTFGFLGHAIGMFSKSFEQVNSISSFVLVPLIYLGGVFFNLDTLDPFWHFFSFVNPLFYLINGIRYATIGLCEVSISTSVILMGCMTIFTFILSYLSLKDGKNYLA